jgi:hypothetical protein
MNKNNEEYSIITEVGTFGDLNIEDPTVKSIKKKNNTNYTEEEIDSLIKESISNNAIITL